MALHQNLRKADLLVDDERVLKLLVRLGYLDKKDDAYYITPLGEDSEIGEPGGFQRIHIQ